MGNKLKIINDPVHGFINIPNEILFDLIEHPYFQRLRRIKQLGLTHFVYPGALHTRFHHAIGAMHLMSNALEVLRSKGVTITSKESEAACIAILLHDVGHGPFSHALEHSIAPHISHENISLLIMHELNKQFKGKLSLAIEIFTNKYHKHFLNQLVSSQLDIDRLDYLGRDSFYTGVSEGVISAERIIKMFNVKNNILYIEEKGIYSVEKFIVARRLMYWQVYLHKTVLSAENMLVHILKRAKELSLSTNVNLFATPAFHFFLNNSITQKRFKTDAEVLQNFMLLDDYDIMASIKVWASHSDYILSYLCTCLVNRNLLKVELQSKPFTKTYVNELKKTVHEKFPKLNKDELDYLVFTNEVKNDIYRLDKVNIHIGYKNNKLVDIALASDQWNEDVLNKTVTKYFLCKPEIKKQ